MTVYGYARVSTNGQDLSIQVEQLRAAGAEKIYSEKVSGARNGNDRPQLARLLKAVNHDDMVLVCRLDRMARSTLDLLNIIDTIAKAGSTFRSLGDAWADTTTPHGRLLLTILSGLASFERDLIMARTQSGIQRARELGVTFGRPVKLNPKQKRIIAERYAKGETMAELAKDFCVTAPTIFRALGGSRKKRST